MSRTAASIAVVLGLASLGCGAKCNDTTPAAARPSAAPSVSSPNHEGRVMPADCPPGTEAIAGKFTADAQAAWQAAAGPHEVVVTVRGATQTCVRNLVASLGGSASAEVLGHGFLAMLSWDQIQRVAAHPDVAYIEPRYGNAPPASPPG